MTKLSSASDLGALVDQGRAQVAAEETGPPGDDDPAWGTALTRGAGRPALPVPCVGAGHAVLLLATSAVTLLYASLIPAKRWRNRRIGAGVGRGTAWVPASTTIRSSHRRIHVQPFHRQHHDGATARTAVQKAALAVGVVFLVVGILGFIPGITTDYGDLSLAGHESEAKLLGIFQVSILHNLVHLLFGAAGIAMARRVDSARTYLLVGGAVYLVLWLYGLLIDKDVRRQRRPGQQRRRLAALRARCGHDRARLPHDAPHGRRRPGRRPSVTSSADAAPGVETPRAGVALVLGASRGLGLLVAGELRRPRLRGPRLRPGRRGARGGRPQPAAVDVDRPPSRRPASSPMSATCVTRMPSRPSSTTSSRTRGGSTSHSTWPASSRSDTSTPSPSATTRTRSTRCSGGRCTSRSPCSRR